MILYSEPNSPYSAVVRIAVYARDLPVRIAPPPGGLKSDEYRTFSGTGTVPCLRLDDGSPLPESTVILAYLDERFPGPGAAGSAEARARVALLVRLGVEGVVDALVGFFHDLSAGDANAKATARGRLEAGLAKVERFLADAGFAAGRDFTQADCVLGVALAGVAMFAGLMEAPDLVARHPKLAAYAARVTAHPAVVRVLAEFDAVPAAG